MKCSAAALGGAGTAEGGGSTFLIKNLVLGVIVVAGGLTTPLFHDESGGL